ncbi:Transcription factor bHLH96 [Orobanche gracilis]
MTLEAVIYQQDPFVYGYRDYDHNYSMGLEGYNGSVHETFQEDNQNNADQNIEISGENWDSPPLQNTTSSSEITCGGGGGAGDGFFPGGEAVYAPTQAAPGRRKRRRNTSMKNKEEMENQRMTHIAVERNRRRQMNDYLAVLRSLMPPSYAQRGDQASIVGGAINFVKELEQLLQFLEAHKLTNQKHDNHQVHEEVTYSNTFSNFFTFPQYSMTPTTAADMAVERRSNVADIEVSMVESHANVKILTKRRPKQLLKMVVGFQSIRLNVLHLNVTTVDQSILYSFNVKVEDECQLTTVNEIATAVHDMTEMIQRELKSNGGQAAT